MKKKYLVAPQLREVMEHTDDTAFEFEIEASPEQATQLQELLDRMEKEDFQMFVDGHIWPFSRTEHNNAEYEDALQEVYRKIYAWGTPQTKQQLEQLHLFPNDD